MESLLKLIVSKSINEIVKLGLNGKVNLPDHDGNHGRNCLAEKRVYEIAARELELNSAQSYLLVSEGFPQVGNPQSQNRILLDELDGTAYYARQHSLRAPPISIAISSVCGETYADVRTAVIGDVQSGEIWSASRGKEASSSVKGKLIAGYNEGVHIPILASDFYFPENAEARLKIRHPTNQWNRFECLNAGSVAHQMVQVATGELTGFFNMVGPTPWELTAGYRIITQAGGFVLDGRTGKPLGESKIEIMNDQGRAIRVPVIAAYNEETARKLYEQITA